MRARDFRAIVFAIASTVVVLTVLLMLLNNGLAATALTIAYLIWLLTRPRMVRVYRRLRGEKLERTSYYIE